MGKDGHLKDEIPEEKQIFTSVKGDITPIHLKAKGHKHEKMISLQVMVHFMLNNQVHITITLQICQYWMHEPVKKKNTQQQ